MIRTGGCKKKKWRRALSILLFVFELADRIIDVLSKMNSKYLTRGIPDAEQNSGRVYYKMYLVIYKKKQKLSRFDWFRSIIKSLKISSTEEKNGKK